MLKARAKDGAYPNGTRWDPRRGDPAEREEVLANIKAVPLPDADPVQGPNGPLTELWRATTSEAAAGGSPGSWTNRSSSGRS